MCQKAAQPGIWAILNPLGFAAVANTANTALGCRFMNT